MNFEIQFLTFSVLILKSNWNYLIVQVLSFFSSSLTSAKSHLSPAIIFENNLWRNAVASTFFDSCKEG